jgi:hypothetical protein
LHSRSTINEELPEVSQNQGDFEMPEDRPRPIEIRVVSNSIFEESRFTSRLEGIASIDPMGACILSLLSKPRPNNNLSLRDSIPITQIEE